jgi:hypothetical protein
MKWQVDKLMLIVLLTLTPAIGCKPRPAGEEPNPQQGTEADPNAPPDARTDPRSGVDVQVGDGEGVDIQVDPNRPGTNVEVGGEDNQ